MPASQARSDTFTIRAIGFRSMAKDLHAADRSTGPALRRKLKTVGDIVANQAKQNASWSSRIPGSIKSRATQRQASVRAGGPNAPHAAPFEHRGQPGSFRHPVFGHRDRWVAQQARPFLRLALQQRNADIVDGMAQAILDVVEQAHFH